MPTKWQLAGAVALVTISLSFIYILFKITVGVILCLTELL